MSGASMSTRDDKARRYIASLDKARVDGRWDELPELIRKVTKHAPERRYLIQAASADYRIAKHAATVQSSVPTKTTLADLIPSLLPESESSHGQQKEDSRQAQASLGWAHWILDDVENVLRTVSEEFLHAFLGADGISGTQASWNQVCLVRSTYIRCACQDRIGQPDEALKTYASMSAWMDKNQPTLLAHPQLSYWSEQLLAQTALLATRHLDFKNVQVKWEDVSLESFRYWAIFAGRSKNETYAMYGNAPKSSSKLSVWQSYYDLLSELLQHGIEYPPGTKMSPRLQQSTELRRVESMYESELLRTTQFPKATESNAATEEWVEKVTRNWAILCGPRWTDEELGQGGRNAVGRSILDVLYRAATKTFHSTLILRRLFQVHKSLTDFDLAYKALDTYVELIEGGRERAAKAKEGRVGQDDDETVLVTIAEGIEGLCSFGRTAEAEKAYHLANKLDEWLERLLPESDESAEENGHREEGVDGNHAREDRISPVGLDITFRAIGIAQARWAVCTPFTENRDSLQRQAVINLKKAITQSKSSDGYLATSYALGLLLAEMREIDPAIEYVKRALAYETSADQAHAIERKLIPLWHLLALLLTARQDFEIAGQTCAASFEQFSSSKALFGAGRSAKSVKGISEKGALETSQRGLVDDMECAELQRIIEIRITELALTELTDGPEEAVNSSTELLGLYSRLFGYLGMETEEKAPPNKALLPAGSSAKSFRGSIFGRRKHGNPNDAQAEKVNGVGALREQPATRPGTQTTLAPTIQVTDENEKTTTPRSRKFRKSDPQVNGTSPKIHRRAGSLTRMIRHHSRDRTPQSEAGVDASPNRKVQTRPITAPATNIGPPRSQTDSVQASLQQTNLDTVPVPPTSLEHDSAPQAKQALPVIDHGLTSHDKVPPPLGHEDQPLTQDVRLPHLHPHSTTTSPTPRFPRVAIQKHALTILAKIWLVISSLYRRANFFEDSREACDEASKAAQRIETLVAEVESSARAFAESGWGGGKSSDEVWADVYCERGELALAIAYAAMKTEAERPDIAGIRDAMEQFEQCLMFLPDHPRGIVGLSNILLDFCEKKIDLGRRVDDGTPKSNMVRDRRLPQTRTPVKTPGPVKEDPFDMIPTSEKPDELRKTPENLNRLAARDRAYGLLATLTKLGSSWDDSEAWYALARAHELGGEVDKSKEILWWCVELEDRRPIRHWSNLGCGNYVL